MANLIKIIKNKSGEVRDILNRRVDNNAEYNIPANLWLELVTAEELQNYVLDGDYVVNNGTADLSPTEGLVYLVTFQEIDYSSIIAKKTGFLVLTYNGSGSHVWLGIGDKLVPTNSSPWSPPYNCRITQVQFTNNKSGRSNTPMINQITCRELDYSNDSDIDTNSTITWYVNNYNSSNKIRESGYGRTWEYDNSAEGDSLSKNKKYAFECENLEGRNPSDILVTLLLEEI